MPDDEHLGGTRDPHEYGRRHRREEPAPDQEKPRRRRRSMEAGGGLSVADLVQKHSTSRPDLAPVDPRQLQQNSLVSGRRARQDRQGAEGQGGPGEPHRRQAPPPPSIADALDEAPEFPRADAPRPGRRAARGGFPPVGGSRRAGEASGHHALPPDGPANSHHAPEARPPGDAPRGRRRADEGSAPHAFPPDGRETSGHHAFPSDTPHPGDARNVRRAGEAPHPGEAARAGRRAGEASAHHAFPPGGRRAGEASAHHAVPPGEAQGLRPRPANDPRDIPGFRAGEASAHHAIPGEPSAFTPDDARRTGEAPTPSPRPRRAPRRAGEASAHQAIPGDTDFPGEARRPVRRAGEASAHHAVPGDDGFPRRPGEASAHHAIPGAPPAPGDARRAPRRGGEPPADQDFPGEARRPVRRAGEAPADADFPGEARRAPRRGGEPPADQDFPGEARRPVRRAGEASAHHAVPGDPNGVPGDPRGAGPRRAGEASAHHAVPGGVPGPDDRVALPRARRVGEASVRHRIPGARRVGEASAHHPVPDGIPDDGRNGFPRDPRISETGTQLTGEPPVFPPDDDAPRNGRRQDPRRQGPPTPPPGQWPSDQLSEPPGSSAAADGPDLPKRPKPTGVPPVPPMPPRREDDDPISMTTEMEAIGEDVQKRRTIDHTLARFSAVHDEIKAEEREKKAKRRKLLPWQNDDPEMDRLEELEAQQSMALHIPRLPDEPEDDGEDEPEEDAKSARSRRKKLRKKLRGRSAGKAFVVIVAGFVFVSTATAWGFKSYIESEARNVAALDPDSSAIQDAAAQSGDENFLLVGSDTRAGAAAEEGVGDESTVQGARSDTVMIAHIPKDRERAVIVSFPRDLEVTRPACEGWDPKSGEYTGKQHPAERRVKLNTAYQIGGPRCVTKMVQELSGLNVNHFVGIDFHGFKDMVDAVRGVEVCVERPLKDEVLGTVVAEGGKNVRLSGDQALNFVRARHVEGDPTSDYGRIIRQQRFLSSLLRKAMSREVLLDPGKLTDFVSAFSKATFGDNIGVDQLFTLGQSMQGMAAGRVTFITVPTVGEGNDIGNEELRVEDTNALFEAIRQDTPLPGEAPANKPVDDASRNTAQRSGLRQEQPQGTVDPKTIKIQVLNGGNETGGIAGDTADALAEFGFQIMRVDSAPQNIDKTAVIRYSKERTAQAKTLQAAVPGSVLVEDPSMVGAIMLIVGPGFDGEIVSPSGGGKPVEVPENLSTVNAGDVSCA